MLPRKSLCLRRARLHAQHLTSESGDTVYTVGEPEELHTAIVDWADDPEMLHFGIATPSETGLKVELIENGGTLSNIPLSPSFVGSPLPVFGKIYILGEDPQQCQFIGYRIPLIAEPIYEE